MGPRIAIVDDHELMRSGLQRMLEQELDADIVLQGDDLEAVLQLSPLPDLLLLDVDLGDHVADPALAERIQHAGCPILVISALALPEAVLPLLQAEVAGFVGKRESQQVIMEAVRAVLDGGSWISPEVAGLLVSATMRPQLSPAQERVLVLYASGMTLETVARHLGMSLGTAQTHLKRARAKYAEIGRAMPSRVDVYREALRDGLISD